MDYRERMVKSQSLGRCDIDVADQVAGRDIGMAVDPNIGRLRQTKLLGESNREGGLSAADGAQEKNVAPNAQAGQRPKNQRFETADLFLNNVDKTPHADFFHPLPDGRCNIKLPSRV